MSNPLTHHPALSGFVDDYYEMEKAASEAPKGSVGKFLASHAPAAVLGAVAYEALRRANKDRALGRSIRLQRESADPTFIP